MKRRGEHPSTFGVEKNAKDGKPKNAKLVKPARKAGGKIVDSCVMCGRPVPDGQGSCSMCYGDPEYGQDGYYRAWLEEGWQQEEEARAAYEASLELEGTNANGG